MTDKPAPPAQTRGGARATPPGLLGADGRLLQSVVCIKCQYDLRGQLESGTCPECGEPVASSTQRNDLWRRPAPWLRGRAEACVWAQVALTAFVIAAVLFYVRGWRGERSFHELRRFPSEAGAAWVLPVILGTYLTTCIVGIYGTPPPRNTALELLRDVISLLDQEVIDWLIPTSQGLALIMGLWIAVVLLWFRKHFLYAAKLSEEMAANAKV